MRGRVGAYASAYVGDDRTLEEEWRDMRRGACESELGHMSKSGSRNPYQSARLCPHPMCVGDASRQVIYWRPTSARGSKIQVGVPITSPCMEVMMVGSYGGIGTLSPATWQGWTAGDNGWATSSLARLLLSAGHDPVM